MNDKPAYEELKQIGPEECSLELNRTRDELRQSEYELKIMNKIAEIFLTIPDDEMYAEVLQVVLEGVESKFGSFGYIDQDDEALILPSLTRDIWDQCQVPQKATVFPQSLWGGIWGQAIKQKKTLYSNKGPFHVPEGHIRITRTMAVPIIHRENVIGILHIANKDTDYDEKDRRLMEKITGHIAPVLKARLERDREEKRRNKAEEEIQRKSQIQNLFNTMLNISMQPYSFEEMLDHIIETIDSISWLALQSKGVVFLTEERPNELVLKSCRNVPENLRIMCNQVPFGWCICGRAASTREIQFASHVDERHENVYEGMPPHGHYCIPILSSDKLLGVLNLYIKEGHHRKKEDEEFLLAMANVLGGIIERKKTEEALRESEERLLDITDNTLSVIYLKDIQGRYILINHQYEKLFHVTKNEIIGKTDYDIFPKKMADVFQANDKKVLEAGTPLEMEEQAPHDDGIHTYISVKFPLFNIQRTPYGVCGISTDITKRKRAEEALKKAHDELEMKVKERTAELTKVNEDLKQEIAERKQIQITLHQSIIEMTTLNTLSRQINASLSLEPVIQAISAGIMDAVAPDLLLIFLRRGDELFLEKSYSSNGKFPSDTYSVHRLGECLCGLALSGGKPIYSRNINADPRCTWEECKRAGLHSFAALPLKIGDEVIGMLGLASYPERDFQQQAAFLETLSNEITIGLQHALLYEERERTEKKLQEFKFISDTSNDAHFLTNRDAKFQYVNKTACNMLGYSEEEFLTLGVPDVNVEYDMAKYQELFDLIQTESVPIVETINKRKDGTVFPSEITVTGHQLNGTPFMFSALRDITNRKQADEKLRESEQRYRILFDQAPDAVLLIDVETGGFVEFNDKAHENLGYTREEFRQLNIPNIDVIESVEDVRKHIENIIKAGSDIFATKQRTKDGEIRDIMIIARALSIHGKDFLLSTWHDFTERKKAEEALKARQQEIEQLNTTLEKRVQEEVEKSRQKDLIMVHQSRLAAMGEMIGLIAHQWKQPLNALNILLYNIKDLCQENGLADEALTDLFDKGINMIMKMSATIDDFRNFFKPNRGKETFSINKIIKDSYSMIDASFKYNNISVLVNETDELIAIGFPNEYSQVILNILNNAKEAILSGGGVGEIVIDVFHKNNSALVSITDNGGGIAEDILTFIFDPYFTTRQEGKGAGMGLYMSKVIIEDHMDGHVEVHNINGGVKFSITTPLAHSNKINSRLYI